MIQKIENFLIHSTSPGILAFSVIEGYLFDYIEDHLESWNLETPI